MKVSKSSPNRGGRWQLIVFLVTFLVAPPAAACNVPVFRYALEHWETDPYRLVIFHRGPLTEAQQVWLGSIRETEGPEGHANVAVETADVAGDLPASLRSLWQSQREPSLPWVVLQYPGADQGEVAWSGSWTQHTADRVLDSPVRRRCMKRILEGDSLIWLVLKSGDHRRDTDLVGEVEKVSRRLAGLLELPTLDDQDREYLSPVPLRLSFAVVPLDRKDPAEEVLVRSLLNRLPEEVAEAGPLIFPVFGRGRALPPIRPDDKLSLSLERAARFLLAACSCQVKRLNPGEDLLWRCDWAKILEAPKRRDLAESPPGAPEQSPASAPLSPLPEERVSPLTNRRYWLLGALLPAGLMVVVTARWAFGPRPTKASALSAEEIRPKGGTADVPLA